MQVAVRTDVGRVREVNEDTYCAFDLAPLWPGRLFAVADGMGGYEGGEVASSLAIMTLNDHLRSSLEQWKQAGQTLEPDIEDMLAGSFAAADAAIQAEAGKRPGIKMMGTTLTAAVAGGGRTWLAHVGDSRAYLMQNGSLRQVTEDHSLVGEMVKNGSLTEEEAMSHPQRNIVTNVLSAGVATHVDLDQFSYQPGDLLLICSDGLTGYVSSKEIATVLQTVDLDGAAEALVRMANERGGTDNITVLLVRLS